MNMAASSWTRQMGSVRVNRRGPGVCQMISAFAAASGPATRERSWWARTFRRLGGFTGSTVSRLKRVRAVSCAVYGWGMSTSDEDFGYACGRLAAVAGWLDVPWSTPDSVTVAISQTKNLREVVLNRLGHDVQEPQWEDDVPTLTMAAWLLEVTVDDAVVGDLPDRSPVITTCLRL